ncbi:unnamed protein product [Kuraishia capsulata CBS 1993]|uniref:Calcineurin-like phosphoesterase domain-containing protein n=1 Tax=Kuraishia capsulata CBS 1993 TaxID=1382522 RepID=W6MW65_9ASCO|nr:uncharacterized protein KUCA_T00002922001 [Kuraishia capsulata CBS 1993]CDK26945.1 unnamed protein product [Kuraishia capsulata CBS 1993]
MGLGVGLPKRFIRLAVYVIALVVSLLVLTGSLRSAFPSSATNVQRLISKKLGLEHEGQVIIGVGFKECWKSSSKCGPDPGWDRANDIGLASASDSWKMIPKDLYLGRKWLTKLHIFYRSIPAEEILGESDVVVDIAIGNPKVDTAIPENKQGYPISLLRDMNSKATSPILKVPDPEDVVNAGWVRYDHGLWVKFGKYESHTALTGLNVLFGRDCEDPRLGWDVVLESLAIEGTGTGGKTDTIARSREDDKEVYLSYKREPVKNPTMNLNYREDGSFKILQVADLHFSTGYGHCRDTFPKLPADAGECFADVRTTAFVDSVLDIEKPDLVVLTGDQVFGDEAPDAETAILKALNPFIRRKIPYALIFGNHDDEGSLSRKQLMDLAVTLPYCMSSSGPEDVTGVGNYVLTIAPPNGNKAHAAASLYFLDTHKYSLNPKTNPGYDWLKEDQLKFVESEYSRLKPQRDAYTLRHMAMAFIHIPLPEYRDVNIDDQARPLVGNLKEGITAPKYNSGMRSVFGKIGVSVVTAGHDHCNDYCLMHSETTDDQENSVWLCYGGAAGEGGYAGYGGTTRRIRTFELKSQSGEIKTWKRLETDPDTKFDSQKVLNMGNVVYQI